jgi:hypothetical protein
MRFLSCSDARLRLKLCLSSFDQERHVLLRALLPLPHNLLHVCAENGIVFQGVFSCLLQLVVNSQETAVA